MPDPMTGALASHLRLLRLFANPRACYEEHCVDLPNFIATGRSTVVRTAYPDLAENGPLLNKIANDLATQGPADLSLHTTMIGSAILEPAINPLGWRLLAFVT